MDLFKDHKKLDTIEASELVESMFSGQKRIQLPSFQRDAVWDEERVQLLWDSILKNFPIGSFLFSRIGEDSIEKIGVKKTQIFRDEAARKVRQETGKTEFIVIDGQQRAIAIALGLRKWREGDSARLWIDLGTPSDKDREDGRYPFYVCSILKPWGLNATDAMRRNALMELGEKKLQIDGDALGKTWPVRAALPVPFAELVDSLVNMQENLWEILVPEAKQGGTHRENLSNLFDKISQVNDYQIPVFLVENLNVDELGSVFQRLNRQGVQMNEEDLFFSSLKLIWPDAHNLVWDLYRDKETGRFMPPAKIVHLTVRLARVEDGSDALRLDKREFKRFMDAADSTGIPYLNKVQDLLERGRDLHHDQPGPLQKALQKARKAILYDHNSPLGYFDPGLPVTMMSRLRWRVWHTLAAWLLKHESVDNFSRMEMIRYVLMDYFYTKSNSSYLMSEPFKFAYNAKGSFPGKVIYLALNERILIEPNIINPVEFQVELTKGDNPRWNILQQERVLVMWCQRSYFQEWFPDFDPTLYQKEHDLPFDVDHIIPQAFMDMRGRRYNWPEQFWSSRRQILHGSGNLRYWPKSLNRADGHCNLDEKYILGHGRSRTPDDSYLREYKLNTIGDVRRASVIPSKDTKYWKTSAYIGKDVFNWSDISRLEAFRKATDNRRSAMYKELFDLAGFDDWIESDIS
jgi:hypothetical protein